MTDKPSPVAGDREALARHFFPELFASTEARHGVGGRYNLCGHEHDNQATCAKCRSGRPPDDPLWGDRRDRQQKAAIAKADQWLSTKRGKGVSKAILSDELMMLARVGNFTKDEACVLEQASQILGFSGQGVIYERT